MSITISISQWLGILELSVKLDKNKYKALDQKFGSTTRIWEKFKEIDQGKACQRL
jgi:hypothetical protein